MPGDVESGVFSSIHIVTISIEGKGAARYSIDPGCIAYEITIETITGGIYGGSAGMQVHAMMGIAALMTLLFLFIWLFPYRRMKAAVDTSDWPTAAAHLGIIRPIILINLSLGLIAALVGAAGPKL